MKTYLKSFFRLFQRPDKDMTMSSKSFPIIGILESGPHDDITDVGDVLVGHCTLNNADIQTGVTVIVPGNDPYIKKPLAGCCVFNGFGKSMGLMQLAELGCVETPLVLTGTFAVGTMSTALIRHTMNLHPEMGRSWPTVNPLVLECNDAYLNNSRALPLAEAHFEAALAAAKKNVVQGSVGAGRGMSTFGCKGGIGSASRVAVCASGRWTVGSLVLSNFGKPEHLLLAGPNGQAAGPELKAKLEALAQEMPLQEAETQERGSIIMVLATDAPLDTLQLNRLAKRAGNGLARTGSVFGHGSGDVAVAFSTAQHWPWPEPDEPLALRRLPDSHMDALFLAAVEATQQAIYKALYLAETVRGRDGHVRRNITEIIH